MTKMLLILQKYP